MLQVIASITGQGAFNARLRCPFAILGTGVRIVPSVAAPPRFDTCPGQRCIRALARGPAIVLRGSPEAAGPWG